MTSVMLLYLSIWCHVLGASRCRVLVGGIAVFGDFFLDGAMLFVSSIVYHLLSDS